MDFMSEFENDIDWYYVAEYQNLNEDFIKKYLEYFEWSDILLFHGNCKIDFFK